MATTSPLPSPDISNLGDCIEEARLAALSMDTGPPDPTDYDQLMPRLAPARDHLPPLYRQMAFDPFRLALEGLGRHGFAQILIKDPRREGMAELMLDIAHTILQNGENYESRATDGFQEVASDLYDGFLSAEDRRGVQPPDRGATPPLVKWGNPDDGPYTWVVEATGVFGVQCAVVSLPPANARSGLFAWSALAHETAGHDILNADSGLQDELTAKVQAALAHANLPDLAEYWSSRIDETASDVFGILNMGPAAGIGLIGYFRALNAAYGYPARLSSQGADGDPHPVDVLRGYLAASTVRLLRFSKAAEWAKVIEEQTDLDVGKIRIEGEAITVRQAKDSAAIVAKTIVRAPMTALENTALGTIQNWRNADERKVLRIREVLSAVGQLPSALESGLYAAHAVAAGVMAALGGDAPLATIFDRMLGILKRMHDANPSWGPLFVRSPGNIFRCRTYVPRTPEEEEVPADPKPAKRRRK